MQTRRISLSASFALLVATFVAVPDLALAAPKVRLAYIDPGSGSFILQALIAAVAGVAVAIGAYWEKLKGILGIGSSKSDEDSADHESNDG